MILDDVSPSGNLWDHKVLKDNVVEIDIITATLMPSLPIVVISLFCSPNWRAPKHL